MKTHHSKQAAVRQAKEESINIVANPTRPEQTQEKESQKQQKNQPECFEKGTGKKVSCGNNYIRERAAFKKN